MRKAGFTNVATSLSLERLRRKGLIDYTEEHGENYGEDFTYTVCILTSRGLDWMLENKDRFKLLRDEDISF